MRDYKELAKEVGEYMVKLRKQSPDQMQGFLSFMGAAESDGALSKKQKILVALGIAVAKRCDPCITVHVRNAFEAGASAEEIVEAAWMAVVMGGGPSLMYLQHVLKAIEDLS